MILTVIHVHCLSSADSCDVAKCCHCVVKICTYFLSFCIYVEMLIILYFRHNVLIMLNACILTSVIHTNQVECF